LVPVPMRGLYPHVIKKGCSGIPHDRSRPLSRLSGCFPAEPGSKPDLRRFRNSSIPQFASDNSTSNARSSSCQRSLRTAAVRYSAPVMGGADRTNWSNSELMGTGTWRFGRSRTGPSRVQTVVARVAANSRRKDNVAGRAMPTLLAPSWRRPCPDPRTNAL